MAGEVHAHRRILGAYLRPERHRAAGLAVLLVVSQVVPLAGPVLVKRFVDQAVAGARTGELVVLAVAYLVVAVVAQGLAVVVTWAGTALAWRVTDRMRADVAAHALSLDLGWHARHRPGELIERVDGDITKISEFYSKVVLQVAGAGLLLVGVLVLVWVQDWRAGVLLTAFAAVAVAVVQRVRDGAVPAATRERAASADLFGGIEERAAGIEDLRANGGAAHAVSRFEEASARSYRAAIRAERDAAAVLTVTHGTAALGTAVALATGVWLFRAGAVSIGTVFLLVQSTQLLRRALILIADQLRQLQKAGAGAARVAELLAVPRSIEGGPGAPLPVGRAPAVRFDDVSLSYDGDGWALRDVSFTVEPGRVVGVIGRTGSGKTTVARLLLRFYDVTAGRVLLDGVDVRDLRLDQLRAAVGIVTQDVQLFDATLRDNLTLFQPDADDARLVSVLRELELGEWYARLPDGLDTVLGAGGTGLSAGEAQLLAFARLFLLDPGVVVLDEASSRLDPGTEARVERAIGRLLAGRTGIVIAHRLATLAWTDDVLVLDHGSVVEHGSCDVLAADPSSRLTALLEVADRGAVT